MHQRFFHNPFIGQLCKLICTPTQLNLSNLNVKLCYVINKSNKPLQSPHTQTAIKLKSKTTKMFTIHHPTSSIRLYKFDIDCIFDCMLSVRRLWNMIVRLTAEKYFYEYTTGCIKMQISANFFWDEHFIGSFREKSELSLA